MLFTDIEGSTRLAATLGTVRSEVLASHHRLIRDAIEAEEGFIDRMEGDAFVATFIDAAAAAARGRHWASCTAGASMAGRGWCAGGADGAARGVCRAASDELCGPGDSSGGKGGRGGAWRPAFVDCCRSCSDRRHGRERVARGVSAEGLSDARASVLCRGGRARGSGVPTAQDVRDTPDESSGWIAGAGGTRGRAAADPRRVPE